MTAHDTNSKVAIGVPVYNKEEFLDECLNSILKQDYENWECVITDNKSKDKSVEIARKFCQLDSRFKLVVNEEFVDQTTNWNLTYNNCNPNAKYFKMVLADDWLFPNFLSEMVKLMDKNPNVGVCTSYQINGIKVTGYGIDYYSDSVFNGKEALIKQLNRSIEVAGSANTLLMRNESLKKIKEFPNIYHLGSYMIDTELFYDLLNVSDLGFIHKILSYTRKYEDTYTHQFTKAYQGQLAGNNYQLYKFRHLSQDIKRIYKRHRNNYAYFYLKKLLVNDRKCIAWHKQYQHGNYFSFYELLMGFISLNPLTRFVKNTLTSMKLLKEDKIYS